MTVDRVNECARCRVTQKNPFYKNTAVLHDASAGRLRTIGLIYFAFAD